MKSKTHVNSVYVCSCQGVSTLIFVYINSKKTCFAGNKQQTWKIHRYFASLRLLRPVTGIYPYQHSNCLLKPPIREFNPILELGSKFNSQIKFMIKIERIGKIRSQSDPIRFARSPSSDQSLPRYFPKIPIRSVRQAGRCG